MKPSGEFGFAPIAADLLHQRAADVLGDVVGIGARPGQLPGESVDSAVMPLEQLRECVAVAGAGGGNETGIWIAADARHLATITNARERASGVRQPMPVRNS